MMLSWPAFNTPLEFSENRAEVLIVENPNELRNILTTLQGQISGMPGAFVVSKNFEPKDITKTALLITDPFNLEFDTKRILGRLVQNAVAVAAKLPVESQNIICAVNHFASSVCNEMDFDMCFTEMENVNEIVKSMGFRLDRSELTFPEQIVSFMRMQRDLFDKQLFIFYNLKACMSAEELELFYKDTFYNKLSVLLIEDVQRSSVEVEHATIIDNDLCVI